MREEWLDAVLRPASAHRVTVGRPEDVLMLALS